MHDLVRRVWQPTAVAAGGIAALAAVVLRDPHITGSWGVCPFLYVTGLYCPACGGLRAANDLAHGHLAAALDSNLLVVALIGYASLVWAVWTAARVRGVTFAYSTWLSPKIMWVLVVSATVFGVMRNLPAGSWLAP